MILSMAEEKTKENKQARSPVVVVLGHVDHGKSSLLEAIREDFVITAKESGGITQHIGAYQIEHNKKKITFIDTPGHEAFSAMRQRGAKIADIAVLVVDAGEGVKEQTKEALNFVKKANIPMVVAFNKMDKPGADPEKVKRQLSELEVVVESYGGKIPSVDVSAKEKQGIDELLETILLLAEIEELKLDQESPAQGTIIESSLDPQKGPMASLILEKGILRQADVIATDSAWAKVKTMTNFENEVLEQALPSEPISVLGFQIPPGVGESFKLFASMEEAQLAVAKGKKEHSPAQVIETAEGVRILNIILKTDVLGSAEAIEGILKGLPQEKVILRILKSEAGDINVADIQLAENGKARLFGFRVKMDQNAKAFVLQRNVKVKSFDVIYELVQAVRKAMLFVLAPEIKRVDMAKFKITHLFKQGAKEQVIGGKVLEGELTRSVKAEVIREEEVIGKGRIKSLQQAKKEVGKVEKGKEAGLLFESEIQVEENDILQVFKEEQEKGTL